MASRGFRPTKLSAILESKWQAEALDILEELGYYAVKVIICNRSGWMDVVACSPTGMFVGIELKAEGKDGAALQKLHIKEILARGGIAFIAANKEQLLEGLAKGSRPFEIDVKKFEL